jgi:anti-sigma-K factor RskA
MKHSDPLIQKIKHTLDQQTLDADTTRRLMQARQSALQPRTSFWSSNYAVPAMVMASVVAIAVLVTRQLPDETPSFAPDSIDTFEILSSRDDLELYENLDFYLWLEEQPLS